MSRHLVVCGIGSGMERSLAAVKDMGVRLTVVTDRPDARVRAYADQVVDAYPRSLDATLRGLREAGVDRADGVLSLGYENPPVVSGLVSRFGTAGLDVETARDCTWKDRRIRVLDAAGVRVPRHRLVSSVGEALEVLDELGLPVVVKPPAGTSSMGVIKVAERSGMARAAEQALALSGGSGQAVVEEYLTGTEHTVEGLCSGGAVHFTGFSDRNYAAKERFHPYFFEDGDTLPSALPEAVRHRIQQTTEQAVRALRLDPAVFSADILLTDEGEVVVLEVAGRMAGARFGTELVPLSTGVELLPNAVRLALDEPLVLSEFEPVRQDAVVLRYLPCTGGRVTALGDLDLVARDERVHDLFWEMDLAPGMDLPVYRSGKDVLAGVIVRADSVAAAEEVARATLDALPLTVEPVRFRGATP
jgi:biotin carboxylase